MRTKIPLTRLITLGLAAAYALICAIYITREDFADAFLLCALTFLMVGQWLAMAMSARRDQAARDLINLQHRVLESIRQTVNEAKQHE